MSVQESLLRSICDAPADDTPRLVYADWLEENNQKERGQLIRVQCQLAALHADSPERLKLERKERALFRGRKKAWKAGLPVIRGVRWGEFTRGFVGEAIVLSAYRFHHHARRIAEAIPLEVLRLRRAIMLGAVGNSPYVKSLREFTVHSQGLKDIDDLTNSPYLDSLAVLDLSYCSLDDAACMQLASKGLPALRMLYLSGNSIGDAGGLALAESVRLGERLTLLRLFGNPKIGETTRHRLVERYGERVRLDYPNSYS